MTEAMLHPVIVKAVGMAIVTQPMPEPPPLSLEVFLIVRATVAEVPSGTFSRFAVAVHVWAAATGPTWLNARSDATSPAATMRAI